MTERKHRLPPTSQGNRGRKQGDVAVTQASEAGRALWLPGTPSGAQWQPCGQEPDLHPGSLGTSFPTRRPERVQGPRTSSWETSSPLGSDSLPTPRSQESWHLSVPWSDPMPDVHNIPTAPQIKAGGLSWGLQASAHAFDLNGTLWLLVPPRQRVPDTPEPGFRHFLFSLSGSFGAEQGRPCPRQTRDRRFLMQPPWAAQPQPNPITNP